MRKRPAIEIALDLKEMPSLAKVIRRRPLPPEVTPVIRVAAGSHQLAQEFSDKYRCSEIHIREACIFFLQQAVLFSGADSYRLLGVSPDAPVEQIREHRRWLLMWLHPDRNKDKWESALFDKVMSAANTIGSSPSSAAAKPIKKVVRRHRRGNRGMRLLRAMKRPPPPSRLVSSVKPLVLLVLAATAFLLSVVTIISVLGAETRLSSHDGPALIGWIR